MCMWVCVSVFVEWDKVGQVEVVLTMLQVFPASNHIQNQNGYSILPQPKELRVTSKQSIKYLTRLSGKIKVYPLEDIEIDQVSTC